MTQLALLADDVTGAADTGVAFANQATTLIAFSTHAPPADVFVLSTESRDLPYAEARRRVRAAATQVADAPWIYKKIDSTLRGDPAGELAEVLNTLAEARALVAPAFPAQGRTTREGRQYVDGVPLEQSAFASTIVTSDLRALFERVAPTTLLPLAVVRAGSATIQTHLAKACLILADAESEADLAAIAEAAWRARVRVWCGSAGLARAWAQHLTLAATVPAPQVPVVPPALTLGVIGSRHPRTREQIAWARAQGIPVIQVEARLLTAAAEAGITATRERIVACPERVRILTTVGLDAAPLEGRALAARLASIIVPLVAQGQVSQLVLSGGDITAAVCHALGADALWLRGEVEPGIPYGVLIGGLGAGVTVVTKAGGFGSVATLEHALATRLRSDYA